MNKKEFRKQVLEAIERATDKSMTRMEAWQAVVNDGVEIEWETFKRFWNVKSR